MKQYKAGEKDGRKERRKEWNEERKEEWNEGRQEGKKKGTNERIVAKKGRKEGMMERKE